MLKSKIILKMIDYYRGNRKDICHFLKVYGYAQTIGKLEGLDPQTQDILEIAAIVHDIACPLCRAKYGNTDGRHQEGEGRALLEPFLAEFGLPDAVTERVITLVTHHHTYTGVDGDDYRILLEADFLVNADEAQYSKEKIADFEKNVFRTKSGIRILRSMYPN